MKKCYSELDYGHIVSLCSRGKSIDFSISFTPKEILLIVSSVSICDGLPPTSAPEFSSVPKSYFTHIVLLPELAYRYKLHRIKVDALTEIRRKIDLEGHEPSELLSSIIEIYDRVIVETAPPKLDAQGKFIRLE